MRLKPVLAIIALSLAVAGTALAKETAKLPSTPAGKRVDAYLAAFNSGNEQTMREYMEKNVAPEALQQWSMEERLTVYRQMKEEMGGLTLRRVVETKENAVTVLAQYRKGDWFKLGFEFEPKGENKLLGIRIENTEPPPDPNLHLPKLTEAQVLDSLEAYLTGEFKADEFSGTVLVVRGGRTVYEKAFGLASREYNIPNRADTKYNLGSINKFFTKIAIGQLVQEGKLSFDDALGKILPEYPNPNARQKVTIRHLLTMTSGIGDFFGEDYDATPKDRIRSIRDYLPLFTGKPLAFEPGTQRKCSNGGYVVLGAVIEKITGGSYYDYVREHVTKPAGMEDTDFFEADAPTPNLAMGYTRGEEGRKDSPWWNNIYTRPARGSSAGGGYSTAPDMLKFSQALKANKFLTPEYTDWLLNDREPSRGGKHTKSGHKEGKGGLGIAGGAPGINAMLEMDLEREYTVIVLSNYDPPSAVRVDRKIRGWLDRIKN